jgi:hypothetical protein
MATVGRMIKYGLLQPEIYAISRVGMEEDRSQLALASD